MELTSAKRRVLERLKRVDSATVAELASELELTTMAIRLHLGELEAIDWVEKTAPEPGSRGRPAARWRLTAAADRQFEDRHAELTLDLIAAMRSALGEEGLDRVIAARAAQQVAAYRRRVGRGSAIERLCALAALRSEEGYRAEVEEAEDGTWLLIEHHCPICDAAKACTGLCASELEVFRAVLGDDLSVERTKHLLGGDRRCVYRVAVGGAEE